MTFMERVAPIVDDTIAALSRVTFVEDPIAGVRYSRATSIVSSAYKRHGRILETALRESLRESNRHKVWHDDAFRVSRDADALVGSQSEDACRQSHCPTATACGGIQVDMVAFDSADQTIRAYEVKRGNGQFDAGKIRSIKRDLLCVQVLLKSYGVELAKLNPVAAESTHHLLFRRAVDPASLVTREGGVGRPFGFPVVERIEKQMNTSEPNCMQLLETP